eukprot:3625001-Alexandrium_andersonii.AAC.1
MYAFLRMCCRASSHARRPTCRGMGDRASMRLHEYSCACKLCLTPVHHEYGLASADEHHIA